MLTEQQREEALSRIELKEGEGVVWVDKPAPVFRLDLNDPHLAFYGVGGLGLFIGYLFTKHTYWSGEMNEFFEAYAGSFLLILPSIAVLLLGYLLPIKALKNTTYVVTNKRFITVKKKRVTPIYLSIMRGFKVLNLGGGLSTIKANPDNYYPDWVRYNFEDPHFKYANLHTYLFQIKHIRKAEEVLELIEAYRAQFIKEIEVERNKLKNEEQSSENS